MEGSAKEGINTRITVEKPEARLDQETRRNPTQAGEEFTKGHRQWESPL